MQDVRLCPGHFKKEVCCVEFKRLAARVGRTFYQPDKHRVAIGKLRSYMSILEVFKLRFWAQVPMIDYRWSGATGKGAFWAVASRVVNELAFEILKEEGDKFRAKYGQDAMFVVVED